MNKELRIKKIPPPSGTPFIKGRMLYNFILYSLFIILYSISGPANDRQKVQQNTRENDK